MTEVFILVFIIILVAVYSLLSRYRIVTEIDPFRKGGKVILLTKMCKIKYRGEYFKYLNYYLKDTKSGRKFTTGELDDVMLSQVYAQYRAKHDIPGPSVFKSMRDAFGLSYSEIEKECKLEPGQWIEYEEGTIPKLDDWKRIKRIRDEKFASML